MDKSSKNLKRAIYTLFFIGVAGQMAFATYIFLHLGLSAFAQDWDVWTDSMANGIIEGDKMGNVALISHILFAFFITICGPLQFIPSLRNRFRKFHRWNGRIYIVSTLLTSLVALFLVWTRPIIIGGITGSYAITGNALLIILFGIMAWRTAMQKRFSIHREWAIRTYIVVSGVWFFRIGFGTWFLLTGFTAPGVTSDLTGWFDTSLYFLSYLGPLALTELYLKVKKSESPKLKNWLALFIAILCPILIGGTLVTAKVFWLA